MKFQETKDTCDCGHNHMHEEIETHIHEDAIVCSGNREVPGDLENIKTFLENELEKLGDWVVQVGGVIGHIKAFAEGGGKGYMISNTSGKSDIKEIKVNTVQVCIAAIVFKVEPSQLERKVADVFAKI